MSSNSSQAEELVLLTGSTGFIGFKTLLELLESSHNNVRLAVRDTKRAESLFSNPKLSTALSKQSKQTGTIPPTPGLVAVPDITAKGAYNEAIKGVTHVIHVASPLPISNIGGHKSAKEVFINPAVRGALEILEAAAATPTVKKVIITSSVVALVPDAVWRGYELSDEKYGPDTPNEPWDEPYESEVEAYSASKTAQQQAIQDWVAEKKPAFDVVTCHPSWVLGAADVATDVESLWKGTNRFFLGQATATDSQAPEIYKPGAMVSVGDVARAHIRALDLGRQEGVRRLALSSPMTFDDIPKVVEKYFRGAVDEGILSTKGLNKTSAVKFDGSETERLLGFTYETFEETLRGLLEQFVTLTKQEKARKQTS